MDIRILGPLEATLGGRSIVPSAHKPRQVLAVLALSAGRMVTTAALMEELWGTEPPRSAATTLQTYVMQLRREITRALAAGPDPDVRSAKDVLRTSTCGYLLDLEPAAVDVHDYEADLDLARAAAGAGDDEVASRLFTAALARWRGAPLVDVQAGLLLEIEVVRLGESRMCALEERLAADLRLGRHHQMLSELAVLTARNPMNESLAATYMTALYRSGRQGDALEAFGRLRTTLVGELGVEPSGRVRRLHAAILGADPALDDVRVAA